MKRRDVDDADGGENSVDKRRQIFDGRLPAPNFGVSGKRRRQETLVGQRFKACTGDEARFDSQ